MEDPYRFDRNSLYGITLVDRGARQRFFVATVRVEGDEVCLCSDAAGANLGVDILEPGEEGRFYASYVVGPETAAVTVELGTTRSSAASRSSADFTTKPAVLAGFTEVPLRGFEIAAAWLYSAFLALQRGLNRWRTARNRSAGEPDFRTTFAPRYASSFARASVSQPGTAFAYMFSVVRMSAWPSAVCASFGVRPAAAM